MANCEPKALTALVVDADPECLSLLASLLQEAGCTPSCFDRGQQALAALRKRPFDILVMAARLPDVDGLTICAAARTWHGDDPVILLLSTRSHRQDRVTALDRGADDCIDKPFDPDELRARIEAKIRRVFGSTRLQAPRPGRTRASAAGRLRLLQVNGSTG
ncbi:MAG TPA: response regulator transcription factor [Herpetosiphonaceae bacterium]|nr:response regulator transcription factor [Herpetosiphonaceae bacterium]